MKYFLSNFGVIHTMLCSVILLGGLKKFKKYFSNLPIFAILLRFPGHFHRFHQDQIFVRFFNSLCNNPTGVIHLVTYVAAMLPKIEPKVVSGQG